MRTITLEEHYATPGFLNGQAASFVERAARTGDRMAQILEQVRDVGEARIAEMDCRAHRYASAIAEFSGRGANRTPTKLLCWRAKRTISSRTP